MPQKRKPPRLYLRSDGGKKVWIIRDGETNVRTGCVEDQAAAAGQKLQEYLGAKYEPERGGRASEVTIGDVLNVYFDEKADASSRPVETKARIGRLNEFFGEMMVGEIRGRVCREFADERGTESGSRRDLEILRAAVNYYHGEYTLDVVPKITLPDKCLPRERWMTRQEVAAMIRAARRLKQCKHIARLLLIGVYTGTRLGAMLGLQWMPNTSGGWVDLEAGIIPQGRRRKSRAQQAENPRQDSASALDLSAILARCR